MTAMPVGVAPTPGGISMQTATLVCPSCKTFKNIRKNCVNPKTNQGQLSFLCVFFPMLFRDCCSQLFFVFCWGGGPYKRPRKTGQKAKENHRKPKKTKTCRNNFLEIRRHVLEIPNNIPRTVVEVPRDCLKDASCLRFYTLEFPTVEQFPFENLLGSNKR